MCMGGGGGTTGVYYGNQDKLFGAQADIATNLYNDYASNGAPILQGLAGQARQGVDANKYAGMAAADAQSGIANSQAQLERQAARNGVNAGSGNFASAMADQQYGNAALMAGSQNQARQQADNLDWARKADVSNMYRGMPGQASAGLSSAASGYGQMAGAQQNQSNMNAQGYGQFGATLGKAFMADGGEVSKKGLRLATGGLAQLPDWRTRESSVQMGQQPNALMQVASGAAPQVMGALAKEYGKPLMKEAWNGAKSWYANRNDPLNVQQSPVDVAEATMSTPAEQPLTDSQMNSMSGDMGSSDGFSSSSSYAEGGGGELVSGGEGFTPEPVSTGAETSTAGSVAPAAETGAATTGVATEAAVASGGEAAAAAAAEAAAAEAAAIAAAEAAAAAAAEQAALALLFVKDGGYIKKSKGLRMAQGGLANVNWQNQSTWQDPYTGPDSFEDAVPQGSAAITQYMYGKDRAPEGTMQEVSGWAGDPGPYLLNMKNGGGLRKNMVPGGEVSGPGGPKDDKVPAMLSDGEFVLNAKAVQMIGKDKLNALNNAGLKARGDAPKRLRASDMIRARG